MEERIKGQREDTEVSERQTWHLESDLKSASRFKGKVQLVLWLRLKQRFQIWLTLICPIIFYISDVNMSACLQQSEMIPFNVLSDINRFKLLQGFYIRAE